MKGSNQTLVEKTVAQDIGLRAKRAVETGRPLFLIVYYQHEAVKLAFLKSLQMAVKDVGLATQTFDPAQRPEHGTGLLYPLLSAAAGEKILALIAGLPRLPERSVLDPSFLEYLNLHRDQIARDKLRFVLFLHTADANKFIEGAGDLWDFRHHTYWLEGKPQITRETPLIRLSEASLSEIALSDENRASIENHVKNVSSLIEQTAETEEKVHLYLDLSRWLRRRHLYPSAAEAAMEGLEILPTSASKLRADLEQELGYALARTGNLSDALIHYQRALCITRETGDRSGEAVSLNNISEVYDMWGKYDEALQNLKESLGIVREIGDRSGEALTCWNLAREFERRSDLQSAIKYATCTVEIEEETKHPDVEQDRAYLKSLEEKLADKKKAGE